MLKTKMLSLALSHTKTMYCYFEDIKILQFNNIPIFNKFRNNKIFIGNNYFSLCLMCEVCIQYMKFSVLLEPNNFNILCPYWLFSNINIKNLYI